MQFCSVVHNVLLTFMDMTAFSTALWMHDKNIAYTAVNVCLSWCACGQNDAASKFSRNVKVAAGSFVHTQCLQHIFVQHFFCLRATKPSSHGSRHVFTWKCTHHLHTATNMASYSSTPIFTQQQMSSHSNKCVFTQQHTHLYTATQQ